MRSDGNLQPGVASKLFLKALFGAQHGLRVNVDVAAGPHHCRFVCTNWREVRRATTLLTKERGTIAWLRASLRPNDTVLDVGANVGIYTIFAAQLGGPGVKVFAVEPHLPNAVRLIENVNANGLGERVRVLAVALGAGFGFAEFNYHEWSAGSAHSQIGRAVDHEGEPFRPAASELKVVTSVDHLIEQGAIPPPALIKIDVDGLEPAIVTGMAGLLRSETRPRAIQVEVGPRTFEPIVAALSEAGYRLDHRHFTRAGQKRLDRGEAAELIDHNLVFVPS